MREIRMPALDEILLDLESSPPPLVPDLRQVPADKAQRNGLSPHIIELLEMGQKRMHLVEQTIKRWRDPARADAIAARFGTEYRELRDAGADPDLTFGILWEMVRRGGHRDVVAESGAMAVLAYLFYSCDIFEREW